MTTAIDLDAYLKRLQWREGVEATLTTLEKLLRAHMSAIPFENFDVLLGRPVRLDLDSVQDKLVRSRRGGYCFEHATLFAAVLETLGFQPVRHSARVVLFFPRQDSPRTHMFLTVELPEGAFVLDPGFGGPAPLFPVPLENGATSSNGTATHCMIRDGDAWILRAGAGDKPTDAWVSTLERDYPVDFEMANHFTATHPRSPFVNRIMMSRFTEDGRVTILNREAAIQKGDKRHAIQLADRVALRSFVNEHFGFDLPEIEQICVPAIPEWS